jgi:hypothetical protein
MAKKVHKEYIILAALVCFLSAATGLAFWAGLFTNSRIQLMESTCQSIAEPSRVAFNNQPASAWKPAGSSINNLVDIVDAPPIRNERGDIIERRCRATAILHNGQRMRFSYKAYDNNGTVAYIGGLDIAGDTRVFRRE